MNKLLLGLVGLVLIGIVYGSSVYNSLAKQNVAIDAQWSQVDSVLQRRFDSIEQAIGGLKASKKTEIEAIGLITNARKIYVAAEGTEDKVAAANNYGGALNGLLLSRSAIGENYPNLKTPDLVGGLIGGVTVEGNENRVNVERMRYNDLVKEYNTSLVVFPKNIIAKFLGFNKRSFFEITNEESRNAPKIAPNLDF